MASITLGENESNALRAIIIAVSPQGSFSASDLTLIDRVGMLPLADRFVDGKAAPLRHDGSEDAQRRRIGQDGAALKWREPEQFHGWRAAEQGEDDAAMDLRGAVGEGLGETL